MSNAIKYSTVAETLALKKGNFYIGTGDVGKGPTQDTGYYNGITPPSNGYTVYLYKETGGPSIYTCESNNQLISITNIIANASYTSITQCFEYYRSQSDKVCVNRDYEPILTDSLIFNIDPGYVPSYPRTNTNLYDLSLSQQNGTLYNGVSYGQSYNDGILTFDGSNDYINFGTLNLSGNCTFVLWIKPSTLWLSYSIILENADNPALVNWRIQRAGNNAQIAFYDNDYSSLGPNITYDEFQQIVVVCQNNPDSSGTITFYKNGVQQIDTGVYNSPLKTLDSDFLIGKNVGNYEYYAGSIAMVQIYNKPLTSNEVQSLYDSQYTRFLVVTPTPTPTPTLTPFFTPTPSPSQNALPIPAESLQLYLNANNATSYPGSGSVWYDLSGQGNNATLYNGPTFSNGAIIFDGTNDYATYLYDATAAMTIITVAYSPNSVWSNYAGLGSSRTNNGFIIHNDPSSQNVRFYISTNTGANTFVDYVYPTNIQVYNMYSVSTNGSNSHKRYLNGSLIGTNTTSITRTSTANNTGVLANDPPFTRYNNVGIRAHIIYNRQLSDAEITQISNYFIT